MLQLPANFNENVNIYINEWKTSTDTSLIPRYHVKVLDNEDAVFTSGEGGQTQTVTSKPVILGADPLSNTDLIDANEIQFVGHTTSALPNVIFYIEKSTIPNASGEYDDDLPGAEVKIYTDNTTKKVLFGQDALRCSCTIDGSLYYMTPQLDNLLDEFPRNSAFSVRIFQKRTLDTTNKHLYKLLYSTTITEFADGRFKLHDGTDYTALVDSAEYHICVDSVAESHFTATTSVTCKNGDTRTIGLTTTGIDVVAPASIQLVTDPDDKASTVGVSTLKSEINSELINVFAAETQQMNSSVLDMQVTNATFQVTNSSLTYDANSMKLQGPVTADAGSKNDITFDNSYGVQSISEAVELINENSKGSVLIDSNVLVHHNTLVKVKAGGFEQLLDTKLTKQWPTTSTNVILEAAKYTNNIASIGVDATDSVSMLDTDSISMNATTSISTESSAGDLLITSTGHTTNSLDTSGNYKIHDSADATGSKSTPILGLHLVISCNSTLSTASKTLQ